ncbi:uncharacterized protein LOC134808749 [Pan troglodytes]|uniref:uncharacterized protein LOC134808749 n=1 Tax=Pan troglodytes TaxID=9598 RepID=UPI0000E244E6
MAVSLLPPPRAAGPGFHLAASSRESLSLLREVGGAATDAAAAPVAAGRHIPRGGRPGSRLRPPTLLRPPPPLLSRSQRRRGSDLQALGARRFPSSRRGGEERRQEAEGPRRPEGRPGLCPMVPAREQLLGPPLAKLLPEKL